MISTQSARDLVTFVSGVAIFLGVQIYLGPQISKYPWAAILIGGLGFVYARRMHLNV